MGDREEDLQQRDQGQESNPGRCVQDWAFTVRLMTLNYPQVQGLPLTDPHVDVRPGLPAVVQHQVGVSVEEGPHLGGLQRDGLHLLHPPHPQAGLTHLWAELPLGWLQREHSGDERERDDELEREQQSLFRVATNTDVAHETN